MTTYLAAPLPSSAIATEQSMVFAAGQCGKPPSSVQVLRSILRDARRQSRLSQMELALRMGYSPRHVSFVEVGRARPSRALIEAWLAETNMPASVRSAALLHAGYAPQNEDVRAASRKAEADMNATAYAPLLEAYDPLPAFLFDADWFMHRPNRAARWLMQMVMPNYLRELEPAANLDMIAAAHPAGFLSHMLNARAVGYGLLTQLSLEVAANPLLQSRIAILSTSLIERFGRVAEAAPPLPGAMAVNFATPAGQLDFLRFQSLVALPQDVTLRSARIEVWLPLDTKTKAIMHRAARTSGSVAQVVGNEVGHDTGGRQ